MRDVGHEVELTPERYREALARDDVWLGMPESRRPEYVKLAFAYFMAEVDRTERLEVLPQVPETLAELKRRGYATAVITSRPGDPRVLIEKLAMVGLAAHLDQVITQPKGAMRELLDKTATLKLSAGRAGIHPRACAYVGDEPRDIMAAMQAGFGAAIAVATGAASYGYLSNHPQFKAHHVMRSMGELVGLLDQLKAEGVR